jgi:hypothetical protein
MRLATVSSALRKALIGGLLCLPSAHLLAQDLPGIPGPVAGWDAASPSLASGAVQALLGGRVLVSDESDDRELLAAVAAELQNLAANLEKDGWRSPVAESQPLRIAIGRRLPDGTRRVAARPSGAPGLVPVSARWDTEALTGRQIVREVARLYAASTLQAYGVRDATFLTPAAAQYLAGEPNADDREAASLSAAAPSIDLSRGPAGLGRLYVDEFCRRAGGTAALRAVWEKAAETRGEPLAILQKSFSEATGQRDSALLSSFAARLFASFESEPGPSHVTEPDLEAGALDAAAPGALSLRHRTFLPAFDGTTALRVAWPEDAGLGVAVVRYRDTQLPADVLYLSPGDVRALSLAGVARVDWAVIGSAEKSAATPAPAIFEPLAGFPYAGLSAQAASGPGGPHLTWTTASHEGLAGWAVFREEVLADGRIARSAPEIVPSSARGEDSMRFVFVDPGAAAGTFYRYTVWAVTEDGLLARAFSATLRTPE